MMKIDKVKGHESSGRRGLQSLRNLDGHTGNDVVLQDVNLPSFRAKAGCFGSHYLHLGLFNALLDVIPKRFSVASLAAVGSNADEQMFARTFDRGFSQALSRSSLMEFNCTLLKIMESARN